MPKRKTETAEMKKINQVLQDIFGYLSDEEESEGDEVSDFENEGNAEVKEVSRRSARKVAHNYNLRHSKSCAVTHQYDLRSLRSSDNEKGKGLATSSADAVEYLDGDKHGEDAAPYQISEKNVTCDGNHAQESQEEFLPCEDVTHEGEESVAIELEGNAAPIPTVCEIPFCRPLARSNQMVIFKLPSLIAIDPKPFDPETYVEQDIYVDDPLGFRRCVPQTNVIRWRKVATPDGNTVIETNARFVRWSDGSLQLLIGKEAFDVSEHDANNINSYIFQRHGMDIYQCQGKVAKEMKVVPSSSCSDSRDHGSAYVGSRLKKITKVREYFPDLDN